MIPEELKIYDYRENLISDKDNPILIQKGWRDRFSSKSHWNAGYGGRAYLSRLNSEDALTWNVFRTLQLAAEDGLETISDIFQLSRLKRILFWGCDVENRGEEQQLLNILIRIIDGKHRGTMTEPDLVIVTEEEVVFVECKLNQRGNRSPWKAQGSGSEKRLKTYVQEFPELQTVGDWKNVYQLIRQYVYTRSLSKHLKKKPLVVPLVNGDHEGILSAYYWNLKESPLSKENVFRDFVTWQDIVKIVSQSDLSNGHLIVGKIEEALERAGSKQLYITKRI